MKKLVVYLALLVIIGFSAFPANASAGTTTLDVLLSKTDLAIGERFDVTIQASNAVQLAGLSYTLSYDPSKVQIAQQASGEDAIEIGTGFAEIGVQAVDKESGVIFYPLLYDSPMETNLNPVPVMTITFIALASGEASIQLDDIEVSNYVSKSIGANGSDAASAVTGTELLMPPGSVKFDVAAAVYFARQQGAFHFDLNGDGVSDAADMKFVLEQIEPVLVTPSAS